MQASVTIAVPSLNQAEHLDEALRSIFAQDVPCEVYVMDCGSTDGTLNVIKSWGTRLAGWQSGPDGGQSEAIDRGIASGTGRYVTWLNSDDLLLEGALSRLVDTLDKQPDAPACYGRTWDLDQASGVRKATWVEPFSRARLALRCIVSQAGDALPAYGLGSAGGSRHDTAHGDGLRSLVAHLPRFRPSGLLDAFVAVNRIHSLTKTSTRRRALPGGDGGGSQTPWARANKMVARATLSDMVPQRIQGTMTNVRRRIRHWESRTTMHDTNTNKIVPVILAGGQGTRLWPLSRSARPKQFLNLNGDVSLFQQTLLRVSDDRYAAPIIVTNNEYRFLVAEQAQELGIELTAIVLEPVPRNTAPAIAAVSLLAEREFGDAVLHILASDHAIDVDDGYWQTLDAAHRAAGSGMLVTFGIVPTSPETGYGYIEAGEGVTDGARRVARFVEKPDLARAEEMLAAGGYLWNSGMFMFATKTFLDEAQALAPDVVEHARTAVENGMSDLDFFRLEEQSFSQAPNISIDYAVFEKSQKVAVVAVSYGWSDLGSWDAVWKIGAKDEAGNVARRNVSLTNTQRSLVLSDHAHVVVDGLEDVAVIASEDAVYVGRLSNAQHVGNIVKRLRADPATAGLTEIHQTAYRPWGGYSSILMGGRFQVKRLFVKPGKKLSLQKHHHRAEHWVVVSGTAEVTVDGEMKVLTENQSIYLPLGCVHRLANPGKILLELIEVQTGSYLGEDDIVRIDDDFGRA